MESLFPTLHVLPELELFIHALCHVTLLSTGEGWSVFLSHTGFGQWKMSTYDNFEPRPSLLEALCAFACPYAAGPKTGRETRSGPEAH